MVDCFYLTAALLHLPKEKTKNCRRYRRFISLVSIKHEPICIDKRQYKHTRIVAN